MSRRVVVMPSSVSKHGTRGRNQDMGNQQRDNRNMTQERNQSELAESSQLEKKAVKNVNIVPEKMPERKEAASENLTRADSNAKSTEPRRIITGKMYVQVRQMDNSEPIEDASVLIYKTGESERVIREVRTNELGKTPVVELAATDDSNSNTNYRIVVNAKGYQSASLDSVEIAQNETIVENIYLPLGLYTQENVKIMETAPPSSTANANDVTVNNERIANTIEESERLDDLPETGSLRVDVVSIIRSKPIIGVVVRVYNSGETENPLAELVTDEIGRTPVIELQAPNIEFSLEPSVEQPYANYNLAIEVPGYESIEIVNIEILPGVLAIQNVSMIPNEEIQDESAELYVIPPHTLYGDYPPKIAEAEIKPVSQSGEIVLSRIVIPEYVVVHDGPPSDSSAANYYVKYKDYIKNVASSEIYATWPEATIMANVLCIQSFTLNRVYTEWYRNRGYQFTITNSTAYDQKYIAGRNIFDSISEVVDEIFANYVARPNIEQPLFTQFCDGRRVSCPRWLSQWGSKALGDQGYSAIDILRNYYGNDIYIGTAEEVSGVPSSWPGTLLEIGSRSDKVRQMQRQLNGIANGYPLIPRIAQDGIYGPKTAEAVRVFQKVFDLPQTGVVDFATWYKISEIYVGVSRIAELN